MNWIFQPNSENFPVAVVWGAGAAAETLGAVLAPLKLAAPPKITAGDTVYFAPGTYHLPRQADTQSYFLKHWAPNLTTELGTLEGTYTTFAIIPEGLSGTPDAPITFEGILDAEGNMPTIDGRGYFRSCAFRVTGSYISFRNFRIIGCQIGFHINGGPAKDGIRIENCEVGEYGTATKRLTVYYQDPNNPGVTSVTPNVLAKPPIAGDSDDNYPLGVECDWSTSNLTIANCYFHDLGSTETADLAAIADFGLSQAWINHYFSHGHALYLWGTCSLQVAPAEVTLLADGSARPLVLSNPCAEDVWLEWLRLDGQPTVRVSWDFAGQHELAGGTIFSGLVLDIAGLSSATLLVRNAAGNCNLGANAVLSFGTSAGQVGHVDIVGCGAPAP